MTSSIAQTERQSQAKDRLRSFLLALGVLTFCFVYILLRLDPRLICQAQQPVFFFDAYFIRDFFALPGGVNALLSALATQFFYHAWTGAVLLVLLFWLVAWNTRLFLRSIDVHQPLSCLHWIPVVFLLALHSRYLFPLALSLGLLWTLVSVNVYVRLAPARPLLRSLVYLLVWAGLYYVAAGQALLFASLVVLYEVRMQHRIVLALIYAALAGSLPYVAASMLFVLHMPDAYVTNLISFGTYNATWLLWGLYAFFPIALVVLALARWHVHAGRDTQSRQTRWLDRHSPALHLIQGIAILCLIAGAALLSYDRKAKALLVVDYHARRRAWIDVLDAASDSILDSSLILYQANRALCHCGGLGEGMFHLPQYAGVNGLFLHDSLRQRFPLQHSDVFLDLGLVNEAQHWTHEAVCITGDSAWNLRQLAVTNLLKNDRVVAAKYLRMLQRTLWHKDWAEDGLRLLAEYDNVSTCERFRDTKACMPASDFLVSPVEPERCLEPMLANRSNKIAFEYFMAYCLLKGDLTAFIKHIGRLNDLDYARIPRHFEEAILIYMQMTGRHDVSVPGRTISPETVRRFNEFYRILSKYSRNKEAALPELRPYADTYWFYGVYYFQPEGS